MGGGSLRGNRLYFVSVMLDIKAGTLYNEAKQQSKYIVTKV